MPIKFGSGERVKSTIDTYVVEQVLSQGAFAHAAKATSTTRGARSVFLKRYFSPTVLLPWYADSSATSRNSNVASRRTTA